VIATVHQQRQLALTLFRCLLHGLSDVQFLNPLHLDERCRKLGNANVRIPSVPTVLLSALRLPSEKLLDYLTNFPFPDCAFGP
jgi:hypothetical protein